MKKEKRFGLGRSLALLLFVMGLMAIPQRAAAQQYGITTLTAAGQFATSNVPANATNTMPNAGNLISCAKYDSAGLLVSFAAQSANTSLATFNFRWSLDGTTNFASTNQVVVQAACAGTTQVNVVTNIVFGSVGYLVLDSIGNQSGSVALTNILVQYSTKPKRNG